VGPEENHRIESSYLATLTIAAARSTLVPLKRKLVIGLGAIGLLFVTGALGLRAYRGPTGDVSDVVPEFPSLDQARWLNGAPQSLAAIRGEVVFLEGWSPS